jgi:hypothetical protein
MGAIADRIRADLTRTTENVVRFLVLDINRRLRRNPSRGGTPVDTGHARANWVPSVGEPFAAEVDGDAAHSSGVADVLAYELGDGPAWVSNNVPYILRLNDGWSAQQPAGFVERAIAEALLAAEQRFGEIARPVVSAAVQSVGASGAENLAAAYSPFGDD